MVEVVGFEAATGRSRIKVWAHRAVASLSALAVAGCGALPAQKHFKGEVPIVVGPSAHAYDTPLVDAYKCYAGALARANVAPVSIAVGDVKDYTGKYSVNEGNSITQGASLMVYSALGKLGSKVAIHERFDTRIGEMELAYTDRRQLGDGQRYALKPGDEGVPWLPYFGGTIMKSRYYIVGGITEANWDIGSGGVQASVSGIGGKGRIYAMNIGVDLRIVDTQSLVVVKTVSISKQIVGEEIGVDVFRFFGSNLFDIHAGGKRQEPLQLGVRTAIEQGVLELLSSVSGVDSKQCITPAVPADSEDNDSPNRDGAVVTDKPIDPAPKQTVAAELSTAVANATGKKGETAAPARSEPEEVDGGYRPKGAWGLEKAPILPPNVPVDPTPATAASLSKGGTVVMSGRTPLQNGSLTVGRNTFQVRFEFDSPTAQSEVQSILESLAQTAKQGGAVELMLTSRDTELLAPSRRLELARQRVAAVEAMLASKDLGGGRVVVTWLPDPSDPSIVRDGVGYQIVAKLEVRH